MTTLLPPRLRAIRKQTSSFNASRLHAINQSPNLKPKNPETLNPKPEPINVVIVGWMSILTEPVHRILLHFADPVLAD